MPIVIQGTPVRCIVCFAIQSPSSGVAQSGADPGRLIIRNCVTKRFLGSRNSVLQSDLSRY